MAAIGTLWHTAAQREKEADLLFVGDQYRRAIEHFRAIPLPAGQLRRLPQSLDELLLDPRFPQTVRHLRRLYPDPMTGEVEWGLLKDAQGGIAGVHSLSSSAPFKTANFPVRYAEFAGLGSYREWVFKRADNAAASDSVAETPAQMEADSQHDPAADQTAPTSPVAGEKAQRNLERARLVVACSAARMQGELACGTLLRQGDQTAWRACMNAASQNYNACIKGQ